MSGVSIARLCKAALAACVLVVMAGYAQADAPGVVGTWRWFNPAGSEVYFNPNGTAQHLSNGAVVDNGVWREAPSGEVDVTWSSGFTDRWQVSANGAIMTGHNSNGALPTVSRER
jgi:hypothetical protein